MKERPKIIQIPMRDKQLENAHFSIDVFLLHILLLLLICRTKVAEHLLPFALTYLFFLRFLNVFFLG